MKYTGNTKPLVCMQTNSTCYKNTRKMKVVGVLWHSTGANNPALKRYVQPSDNAKDRAEMLALLGVNKNHNDWNHITRQAGLNCWVGKLADGSVVTVQTMKWDFRPWGCGSGKNGSCNSGWIQFEICEDGLSDRAYFNKVYREACELTAYLCRMYGIDPYGYVTVGKVKVPTILCHWDSYKLGMGGGHSDIYHWFDKYGVTMQDIRRRVAELMDGVPDAKTGNEEEIDMTKEEMQKMIDTAVEKAVAGMKDQLAHEVHLMCHPVYERLEDVPAWYQPTVRKMMEQSRADDPSKKLLEGTGQIGQVDVSEDFARTMTVLDRAGVFEVAGEVKALQDQIVQIARLTAGLGG